MHTGIPMVRMHAHTHSTHAHTHTQREQNHFQVIYHCSPTTVKSVDLPLSSSFRHPDVVVWTSRRISKEKRLGMRIVPFNTVGFLPSTGRYTCCCAPCCHGAAVPTERFGGFPRSLMVSRMFSITRTRFHLSGTFQSLSCSTNKLCHVTRLLTTVSDRLRVYYIQRKTSNKAIVLFFILRPTSLQATLASLRMGSPFGVARPYLDGEVGTRQTLHRNLAVVERLRRFLN